VPLGSVPTLGRSTQGVRIMRFNADDKIAATTVL
jgi:DNA gyrase/topoisomerase IV subunit A